MISYFDHVYSHLRGNDLDAQLERMKRAGFELAEGKVRHRAGMLNGFVRMTGTYLEFISIVDEAEFEREAKTEDRIFRKAPKPSGIGAVSSNLDEVHRRLSSRFPDLKKPYISGKKDDPESKPVWRFCPFPFSLTPGANVFPLEYLNSKGKPVTLKQGANSIFGVTGFLFCSDHVDARVSKWQEVLEPVTREFSREGNTIRFGAQQLKWITPEEYEQRFERPWQRFLESPCGEIAAVLLGVEDLDRARDYLSREGFFLRGDDNQAWTLYDDATGFTFVLERGDPGLFLQQLNERSR